MNEGNAFMTKIAGYDSTDNLPIVNCWVFCCSAQFSSLEFAANIIEITLPPISSIHNPRDFIIELLKSFWIT